MILYEDEMQAKLFAGADTLAKIIAPNYGPIGRNTIVDRKYDLPMVVNTGRKILKDFTLEDPVENMGAVLLRDAALKIGTEYGDGTIGTVVLTHALLAEGRKAISAGANPMLMRSGLAKAEAAAVRVLSAAALPCEGDMLRRFAVTTAKSEEIGNTVMDAVDAVGVNGVITVQDSQAMRSTLNIWDGVRFDNGLMSFEMATDKVNRCIELENPAVLLVNYKIKSMEEILNVLQQVQSRKIPLLIIASDIENSVVTQLTANLTAGRLNVAAVTAPGHGDTRRRNMLALAAKTGALLFETTTGRNLKDSGLEVLGRVEKAKASKSNTLLQGFPMEDAQMIGILQNFTEKLLSKTTDPDEIDKLELTMSILNGKVAEIISGGVTEYEMFEKMYLAQNCVRAVKSAANHGLLPGGGAAWLLAAEPVRELMGTLTGDEKQGAALLLSALTAPIRTLADNAGADGSAVLNRILRSSESPLCYNTLDGTFCSPADAGIYDAADTVTHMLEIAADTAASLLTASAAAAAKD